MQSATNMNTLLENNVGTTREGLAPDGDNIDLGEKKTDLSAEARIQLKEEPPVLGCFNLSGWLLDPNWTIVAAAISRKKARLQEESLQTLHFRQFKVLFLTNS